MSIPTRVADEHLPNLDISTNRLRGCTCGSGVFRTWTEYVEHVARQTLAAAADTIARLRYDDEDGTR